MSNRPLPAMQVHVKGRIDYTNRFDGKFTTRITTPAQDEYSRPQVVAVRSGQRLGQTGDVVSVVCTLGGYQRKPYRVTDKDTGETVSVTPVDMTLDAVE